MRTISKFKKRLIGLFTLTIIGISHAGEIDANLLPGFWTSSRHDYVYRQDGTWEMLPKIESGTNGLWSLKGDKLSITYRDLDSPTKWEQPQEFTITKLTITEFFFVRGNDRFSHERTSPYPTHEVTMDEVGARALEQMKKDQKASARPRSGQTTNRQSENQEGEGTAREIRSVEKKEDGTKIGTSPSNKIAEPLTPKEQLLIGKWGNITRHGRNSVTVMLVLNQDRTGRIELARITFDIFASQPDIEREVIPLDGWQFKDEMLVLPDGENIAIPELGKSSLSIEITGSRTRLTRE